MICVLLAFLAALETHCSAFLFAPTTKWQLHEVVARCVQDANAAVVEALAVSGGLEASRDHLALLRELRQERRPHGLDLPEPVLEPAATL